MSFLRITVSSLSWPFPAISLLLLRGVEGSTGVTVGRGKGLNTPELGYILPYLLSYYLFHSFISANTRATTWHHMPRFCQVHWKSWIIWGKITGYHIAVLKGYSFFYSNSGFYSPFQRNSLTMMIMTKLYYITTMCQKLFQTLNM